MTSRAVDKKRQSHITKNKEIHAWKYTTSCIISASSIPQKIYHKFLEKYTCIFNGLWYHKYRFSLKIDNWFFHSVKAGVQQLSGSAFRSSKKKLPFMGKWLNTLLIWTSVFFVLIQISVKENLKPSLPTDDVSSLHNQLFFAGSKTRNLL